MFFLVVKTNKKMWRVFEELVRGKKFTNIYITNKGGEREKKDNLPL